MTNYEESINKAVVKIECLLREQRELRVDPAGARELAARLSVRLHPLYCAVDDLCRSGVAVLDGDILRAAG